MAHTTISDSWKQDGRLDDRVTLVNGEKFQPLPMEGRIRKDSRIREAVIFGIGRAMPGLLAFRSDESEHLLDVELIDVIWPAVEDANSRAESFAQIGKEVIIPLPATRKYPQTDKETIIRARVYEKFAPEISALYERLGKSGEGTLKLGLEDLKRWLLRIFQERLEINLETTEESFFAAGVDSLKAARMLTFIRRELFLNGNSPSTNAVYDAQNVEQLALYLHDIQTGTVTEDRRDKQDSDLASMIETHSKFDRHVSQGTSPAHKTIFLTGATGFLGSYILAQLLQIQSVARIYCPVRASSPKEARDRLLSSLSSHGLSDPQQHDLDRLRAIDSASVANPAPSLPKHDPYSPQLTHIIHCAWPVNFNLPLSAFDDQITYLHRLLQLSLSTHTPEPAHLIFCSSVSATSLSPSPVPETPLPSSTPAPNTGYGRSKLVAEKVIQRTVEGAAAKASILRIGQIVGDTFHRGVWKDTDAVPLMVRSALAVGALPALNERCAWLPVDTVARSVLDIAELGEGATHPTNNNDIADPQAHPPEPYVFNVVNPCTFAWTEDFLPALRASGLQFETVAPKEWVRRLWDGERDAERNPSVKLLGFWEEMVEVMQAHESEMAMGRVQIFDTAMARGKSPALCSAPDVIEEGYVPVMLRAWMEKWTDSNRFKDCVDNSMLA